ncbi:DNA-binding response regulator [Chitinophaga eiseniae]|uniref:Helix-turn-helix domain-containing protein n=1 Tax=Chitinophaga eiseniae TaxID=634771 RepID=A0A847SX01_9BACT|nr:DNA-binding response regulator [Chitinophaga eiseniae]NLR82959.1 helix-turn-helix domain-containing protein [Chitinophaga eiseniae]
MEESKILIIGSHEMRADISVCLCKRFIKLEARNEIQGWRMALKEAPDLIILGAEVCGIDGNFCRLLKADPRTRHIPLILLSAVLLTDTDADVSLCEPLTNEKLQSCINNIFRLRKTFSYHTEDKSIVDAQSCAVGSPDFMAQLIQAIEENMHLARFSVPDLCRVVGISRSALYKKFNMHGGMTVGELMKSLRLKRAAHLLKGKRLNVSEVAWEVGFNDRKYFSREFRKFFGQSPTAYMIANNILFNQPHRA